MPNPNRIQAPRITAAVLAGWLIVAPQSGRAQDDAWTNLNSMPTARLGLCAAAVDGKIYAIGG